MGALIYAVPACRVDCAYAIGILARCLTYPTAEMDAAADRVLVYLAQHADDGVVFDSNATAPHLHAYSDSDWSVEHSTSGWAIMFGGAAIGYGSKRQHSVALSSTEAEIIAASQAAAEVIYFRGLLRELGYDMSEPTVLHVDNSGAVELSKDIKSCQRSRHVERRYFFVREQVALGEIVVKYCHTAKNHADALTKPLDSKVYVQHVEGLMGKPSGIEAPRAAVRQRTFDVEAAYLKGKFDGEVIYARPPPGKARRYVRGVPVVWRLKVPLYGEADAGRIWNRTLLKQLRDVQNFTQSRYDPCLFYKVLADGTKMVVAMYVDDGYVVDMQSVCADAELAELNAAFKLTLKPASFFLGANVHTK